MRCLGIALIAVAWGPLSAAEGMWLPEQLPQLGDELKSLGLEIDARRLSTLTSHPLNAVIDLGGCTASFVSAQGLVVTNHHCAQGSLQYNSSEAHNLMEQGFLAALPTDELRAAPGSRVRVTVEVSDVTDAVTADLDAASDGAERFDTIESRQKQLVSKCEEDPGHRCRVRSFHGGLQYLLYKQLEILDVRLVYAPSGSIGAFGGDVDNWMWPRHTGDFSFLRAYVGADGAPAEYSETNLPYRPKHWLRVATDGLSDGDFVMVAGYPGRTNRYRLSSEARNAFEWSYPNSIESMRHRLALIDELSGSYPEVEIAYASTVAGLNNTSKNYQGMLDGYARSGMVQRKAELERRLQQWVESDSGRREKYGSMIAELEALIAEEQRTQQRDFLLGQLGQSAMLSTARTLYRLSREREKPDGERKPGFQERDMVPMRQRMERLERRYHPEVDKAFLQRSLNRYLELPADQRIAALDRSLELDDISAMSARLDSLYAETTLNRTEVRAGLLDADRKQIESHPDPFLQLAVALYDDDRYRESVEEARAGEFQRLRSRYMKLLIDFLGSRGRPIYPDANSSLRVTYGTVKGYSPRDGVSYEPFTRLAGIAEKHTGQDPFDSPARQLELIASGKYSVPVNFLSTVDTTGGNSGSPTLNGKGELVGLLFDGTYDSINAYWDFNERTTRSIHVDVRYMLWVMQQVDRAGRVLEELGIESVE